MCVIDETPFIETRRLALRSPHAEDAARLAKLGDDFAIARMTCRMPHPYSLKDAEGFIQRSWDRDPKHDASFVIDLEDEGVVGCLGFFANADGATEVGYWVGRDWWGRGIATEALTGALNWASRQWRKRLVTAGHFADNPVSGAVLTRAGFLYTGVTKRQPSLARGEPVDTRMMVWLA